MEYLELFTGYVRGALSPEVAAHRIAQQQEELSRRGLVREAERANLCASYFSHFDRYNHGLISRQDLLLFLRDFILYLGRTKLPPFVEQLVRESGGPFGLSVASDGTVDATLALPDWLEGREKVEQVYALSSDGQEPPRPAIGDRLLTCHTPFETYRSVEQKIAVHAAMELPDDHTMMIALPTGSGKSLVTQLLAAASPGLTLVIVPTVALAKDQFLQAEACISVPDFMQHTFCYRSDMDPLPYKTMLAQLYSGTARLVITSPEAILKNKGLNDALRHAAAQRTLHNVVVDEAHIVPDWGLFFRPDFQIFSVVLRELRALSGHTLRTYLLSATLSEDVVETLFDLFGVEGHNVQYRCDALRQEPRFLFSECHHFIERKSRVLELVQCLPKPLILYVLEPKDAEEYQKALIQRGYKNIGVFTGNTRDAMRDTLLTQWKQGFLDVMIATSAFGMGVDKPNVRTILHACTPENMSRFYQEVGRAGRDGLPSLSVLVPYMGKSDQQSDLGAAFGMVSKSILGVDKLVVRWFSMLHSPKTLILGQRVTVDLNTVPSTFSAEEAAHTGKQNMMWNVNALLLFHRKQYIQIDSAQYLSEQNTYYFTFQMRDPNLLNDEQALRNAIAPDREQEQANRLNGYHQIADLVHKPRARCWAKRFTRLFPLAEEVCSGCPAHADRSRHEDDNIRIRETFPLSFTPAAPAPLLKRYLGSYHDVVIPTQDAEDVNREQLLRCADQLSLSCVVLPDTDGLSTQSETMVLRTEEFLVVGRNAPWLFRKGVLLLFDNDSGRNDQLFRVSHTEPFREIAKILLCRETMLVSSQMRPLNEFLDCNQTTLDRLLKE